MSRTIDERVVSMQFDNKHFESNVKTTMSTLDKLKQSLNLTGASKGLESINTAARKCDLNPLSRAAETVGVKFSAMQVMATTALANITNSAINAGKRIVESLTIAPVGDGFKEYEMMLNTVQTTMAATGKTASEVESELKKLDEYADKTVYSTADMMNSIPKFTNAGVELETATKAMIGIANAVALAGGGANEASSAFYNLGQAIGTGYLTRVDYNSINNVAKMTTMEWKNQMVEAAIALGTLTKVGEDSYKAGSKTLSLQQLFIDGLQEQWATTEVMLKVFGDYGDETTDVGKKAYSAAQDIKTFTQMMESLKATAGTGWKDTWQIIVGDLDKAKALWTSIGNAIGGVLSGMSDRRNKFLESALGKKLVGVKDKIEILLGPAEKAAEAIDTVSGSISDLGDIVNKVIKGDFGNGQERIDKLTEAGYNYCEVQNKVNEALGSSFRHSEELVDSQGKSVNETKKLTETEVKNVAALAKMSEEELRLNGYTNEQVKAFKELKSISEKLGIPLEELITNFDEIDGRWLLLNSIKNIGQSLVDVFNAVKEAWQGIFPPKSIEDRAEQLFNLIAAVHKFTTSLTGVIFQNGELTDTGEKLVRTLKGVFAIIDIITTIAGGAFKIAFKVLTQILGYFDMDILDLTAKIGDIIVKFRDWVDSLFDVSDILDTIVPIIEKAADAVKQFVDKLKELWNGDGNVFSKIGESLKLGAQSINDAIGGLWSGSAEDILSGLINGLKSGATRVWEAAVALAKSIWEGFCNFLGIKSPSTKMEEAGGYAVDGLVNGLKNGELSIVDVIKTLAGRIIEAFKNLDLAKAAAVLTNLFIFFPKAGILKMAGAAMIIFNNLGMDAILGLKNGLASGAGSVLSTVGDLISALVEKVKTLLGIHSPSKVFFAIGTFVVLGLIAGIASLFPKARETMKNLASSLFDKFGSIGKSAGSGISKVFTTIKNAVLGFVGFIKENFGAIGAILGGLGLVALVLKLTKALESFVTLGGVLNSIKGAFGGLKGMFDTFGKAKMLKARAVMILLVAAAITILVKAISILADLEWNQIWKGLAVIGILGVALGGLAIGLSKFIKDTDVPGLIGASFVIIALSGAIMILVSAMKKMDEVNPDNVWRNVGVIIAIAAGISAIAVIMSKIAPEMSKGTLSMVGIALAVLVLVSVLAKLNALTIDDPAKTIGALIAMVAGLSLVALMAKGVKAGSAIGMLGIVIAIRMFIGTLEKVAAMDTNSIKKSLVMIITIMVLFAGLMVATRFAGDNALKAGVGIIAISLALRLVIGAIKMLANMDETTLNNGLKAIGKILLIFGVVVALSYFAGKEAMKAGVMLMAMSVALLIVAGAVALLSNIKDPAALQRAVDAVSQLMLIFALVVGLSKFAKDAKGSLIAIAVTIGILVAAIGMFYILAKDSNKLFTAVAALSTIILTLGLLIASLKFIQTGKGDVIKTIATLAVLAILVVGLSHVIKSLTELPNVDNLLPTVASLSILLVALAGVTWILSKGGKGSFLAAAEGALAMMAVIAIVGVIAMGLGALAGLLKPEQTDKIKTGLENLMDIIVILCTGLGEAIGGFLGGLLGGAIAGFGQGLSDFMENVQGFVDGLRGIDTDVIEGAKNLAGAILALTGASMLSGLASIYTLGQGSFDTIGEKLASFGSSMKAFSESVSDLSEDDIAKIKTAAEAGTAMADMAASVPKTGGWWQDIAGEADLESFGLRMEAFGESLVLYAKSIMELTADDITRIKNSAAVGNAMAELEAAVPKQGGWWQDIAGESNIETFGLRMEAFGKSLIKYAASISTLTADDATRISDSAIAGNAMTALEDSVPKQDGWWQAIAGESDIETFGLRMVAFGNALVDYVTAVSELPDNASETIDKSKKAAEALVAVADVIPKDGGWWGDIAGEQNVGEFGTGMYNVARGLKKYSEVAAEIDDTDVENIENTEPAIKALKNIISVLPKDWSAWTGVDSIGNISTFGNGLVSLANGVVKYANVAVELDQKKIDAVTNSKTAIVALADAAKALPNEGGFAAWLSGDNNNFASFGSGMCSLIQYVVDYSAKATGITEDAYVSINNSAAAIAAMAMAAKALPNDGGMVSWLSGDNNNLALFGTSMCALIQHVVDYAAIAVGLSEDGLTAIGNSKLAIVGMADAAKALPNDGGIVSWFSGDNNNFAAFGEGMCAVARAAVEYYGIVSSSGFSGDFDATASKSLIQGLVDAARSAQSLTTIDLSSVSTTVDELIKIANLAKSLAGTDFGNMGSFAKALGSLGQSGVDSFLRAFSGSYGKARQVGEAMMTNLIAGANVGMNSVIAIMNGLSLKMVAAISTKAIVFMTQGSLLMTRLASGILRAKQTVIDAVSSVLSGAFGDLTYVYMDWYHVGTYLVDGFASGISSRTWKAKAQASAMAQAALNAAKKVLDINSPSKKFREIGRSVPEGFALGIGDLGTSVKKAAENMAQKAMSNMRNAISKVLDVIDLDVDTQPTIRPVLDLDNVASGVQTLNSMFGLTPSVGVLSNVNSIGSMMNRNQNGASRNESTNPIYNTYNSYNIDGVTYDDGSNVANAVETLIRATKVGGRR